ncbi:PAS domain-containing sensor histidine kinase [Poseidonibacter lekithochrous]|uniref:PAS domain-containing sensor histidine kinase n=1 Tax=Poseidonibacter lekithochrous TaxID=1904463 RepID=UPI0008FC9CED|nr:PAS domain-containing sensor histidine kinase [Poseidonibacter lekithochrous]QKJ23447.1 PAS sensor-containing signal transduction histidine kinase [Poseidonibacter lekithochrous]
MDNNLLDFFMKTSSDLVYEINVEDQTINWYRDIHTILNYKQKINLNNFENLSKLLHKNDIKKLYNKLTTPNQEQNQISFRIKDALGNYQTWNDTYIRYENKIIGICKYDSKIILQEQEEKTENILDSTTDLIFYKDLDLNYMGCNESFCNFVGLDKKDILGKNDYELFGEKHANKFRQMDNIILEKKVSNTNKEWVTYPNLDKVLLLTQKSPLINKNNEIYGLLGISRDITKEIDYKNEIKESKKRYKKLFQANKIPVLLVCPDSGDIIKANKAAQKFYGYTSSEIKKLHITQINTLSSQEIQKEMMLAKNEERDCFNFKHKIKSGKLIDVEVYAGPIKFKNKKILYSLVFDITKRKQAEKKLKQAHTIYQNTKEGIFITDLNGKILSVNKAFEQITGYQESEVIDKNSNLLKSDTHSKKFYSRLWKTLAEKGLWEGEIINKTKAGKIFPQWLTINTVYDESHQAVNYIAVFTDFTKLKEQEQLLREKDQIMFQQSKMASMGEMLRNIAHQWRQPLSVITSSATGLKLKKEFGILNDEDFSEFADGILKSTNYLSETIEDFSNYFKNSKNKEYFFISEILDKTTQLSKATLKNSDIKIEIDVENNYEIYGIKNELIQILLNLINNTKDAYNNKQQEVQYLKIYTKKYMNNVVIFVRDIAGGIPENILTKVFEPYFTTKHQSQGTGIGLYMSKQIVEERLKGAIDAYNIEEKINDEKYKGMEFKITIPISQSKTE